MASLLFLGLLLALISLSGTQAEADTPQPANASDAISRNKWETQLCIPFPVSNPD